MGSGVVLGSVLDALEDPLLLVDHQGKVYECNQASCSALSVSRAGALADSLTALSPGTAALLSALYREAPPITEKQTRTETVDWMIPSGGTTQFITRISRVNQHSANGKQCYVISLKFPLGGGPMERRASGKGGFDSLGPAFDATGEPLLALTDSGVIVAANQHIADVFGHAAWELAGKSIGMLLAGGEESEQLGAMRESLRDANVGPGEDVFAERVTGKRRDGSELAISLTVRTPTLSPPGSARTFPGGWRFICVLKDLTVEERTANELRRTRLAENILLSLPVAAGAVDQSRRVVVANRALVNVLGARGVESLQGKGLAGYLKEEEHFGVYCQGELERHAAPDADTMALNIPEPEWQGHTKPTSETDSIPIGIRLGKLAPGRGQQGVGGVRGSVQILAFSLVRRVDFVELQSKFEQEVDVSLVRRAQREAMIGCSMDAVIGFSELGTVREYSKSAEGIFGWRREEVIGRDLSMLVVGETRGANLIAQLVGKGDAGRALSVTKKQVLGRRKGGQTFPLLLSFGAVPTKPGVDGRPFMCFARSIQDQYDLQKELNSKRQQMNAALCVVAEGLVVVGESGCVVACNPGAARMLGWRESELLGLRPQEFMNDDMYRCYEAYVERQHNQRITSAAGTNLASPGMRMYCRRRDGEVFPVAASMAVAVTVDQSAVRVQDNPDSLRIMGPDPIPGDDPLLDAEVIRQYTIYFRDLSEKQRTETALESERAVSQSSISRMAAIFGSALDAIVMIDMRGKILEFNPAAERLFGHHGEEVIGHDVSVLMNEQIGRVHQQYIDRYLQSGELASGRAVGKNRKLQGKHKDGHQFPITLSLSEVAGNPRDNRQFVGVIRDISDTERLVIELENQSQHMEAVFNSVADGVVVVDESGTIRAANQSAVRMFARATGEMAGMKLESLLPDDSPHKQELAKIFETASGTFGGLIFDGRPVMGRKKDGREFPINVSVKEVVQTRRETHSRREMTVCIRDLTERVQAEEALQTARKESVDTTNTMEAIFGSAIDAIILINDRGLITHFNSAAERLFGFRATEVMGRNVSILMPDDIGRMHQQYMERYLRSDRARGPGVGRNRKLVGRRKDGGTFSLTLSLSEVTATGKERQFVGFIRDLTEVEKLMEQLEDKSRHIEAIFNSTVDAMVTVDHDRVVNAFNAAACRMFACTAADILGGRIELLVEDPRQIALLFGNGTDDGIDYNLGKGRQLIGRRLTGELFPMLVTLSEVPLVHGPGAGKKRQFTAVIRDLTELKQIAMQLSTERADNAKMRAAGSLMMNCLATLATDDDEVVAGMPVIPDTTPAPDPVPPPTGGLFSPTPSPWAPHPPTKRYNPDTPEGAPASKKAHLETPSPVSPILRSAPDSPPKSRLGGGCPVIQSHRTGPAVDSGRTSGNEGGSNKMDHISVPEVRQRSMSPTAAHPMLGRTHSHESARSGTGGGAGFKGGLLDLPPNLLGRVFLMLDQWSLLQLRGVCKTLAELLNKLPLDWTMRGRSADRRVLALSKGFTRLHSLKLGPDTANLECLRALSTLQQLQVLDLSFCHVHDTDLRPLTALTSIRALDLNNNELGGRSLRDLAYLTDLVSLNLTRCGLEKGGLEHLSTLTHLQSLHLAGCTITHQAMQVLGGLTTLTRLDLADTELTVDMITTMSGLSHLHTLNLSGGLIDDGNAACMTFIQSLHDLTLDYSHNLTPIGLSHLVALPAIASISLTDCPLTDDAIRSLTGISTLRRLVLSVEGQEAWLTDEGMRHMGSLSTLTTLILAGQELITDAGAAHLARLNNLANIDLSYTGISEGGVAVLASLVHLRIVELYGCNVDRRVGVALERALPGCRINM